MITTKAVRTGVALVILAGAAVVAVEVYWGMQARNATHRAAEQVAAVALNDYKASHNSLHARQAAEKVAAAAGVHLDAYTLESSGFVRVTVSTHARSYVLRRFGPTRSVSEITVSATAPPS